MKLDAVRALVVDEDPAALEREVGVLARRGLSVEYATSAGQALTMAVSLVPDLLLVGVELGGRDGLALVHRLRSLPPERGGRIPAITVADALLDGTLLARWRGALCQGHVARPIDETELFALVEGLAGVEVDRRRHPHPRHEPERRHLRGGDVPGTLAV